MINKIKFICSVEFYDDEILNIEKRSNDITFMMTSNNHTSLLKLEFINVTNSLNITNYSLLGKIEYKDNSFILPLENNKLIINASDVVINDMNEDDNKYVKYLR